MVNTYIYGCLNTLSVTMMRRAYQFDKEAEKWYSTSNEFNVIVVWRTRRILRLFSHSLLFWRCIYVCSIFFLLDIFFLSSSSLIFFCFLTDFLEEYTRDCKWRDEKITSISDFSFYSLSLSAKIEIKLCNLSENNTLPYSFLP